MSESALSFEAIFEMLRIHRPLTVTDCGCGNHMVHAALARQHEELVMDFSRLQQPEHAS